MVRMLYIAAVLFSATAEKQLPTEAFVDHGIAASISESRGVVVSERAALRTGRLQISGLH